MTRDEKGRYAEGHKGVGGRPKKEREVEYYRILVTGVTPDDWKAIIAKATEQAKRGDAVARKFLADYLIGTPDQNVNMKHSGEVGMLWDWDRKPAE